MTMTGLTQNQTVVYGLLADAVSNGDNTVEGTIFDARAQLSTGWGVGSGKVITLSPLDFEVVADRLRARINQVTIVMVANWVIRTVVLTGIPAESAFVHAMALNRGDRFRTDAPMGDPLAGGLSHEALSKAFELARMYLPEPAPHKQAT